MNQSRANSIWPLGFGLACCAIEMMATLGPGFDLSRFGAEVMRPSPRQADLMIVAGRVSLKMAPVLRQLYDQMPDPKWVISMGACASCGGIFNNYAILQGVDKIVPVDVYVPGCPPRPEALIYGIIKLQEKILASGVELGPLWRRQPEEEGGRVTPLTPERIEERLRERFPGVEFRRQSGEAVRDHTLHLPAGSLVEVCTFLRDDPELDFAMLSWISGVDWLPREPRFEVVYGLLSLVARRAPDAQGARSGRRTRASPRSPACGPRPTGSSARPATSTGSSSPGIPTWCASCCPRTGWAGRCARTRRWATRRWPSRTTRRTARSPRPGSGSSGRRR